MPNGDGTGPVSGTQGKGQGKRMGNSGGSKGKFAGSEGNCICPACGKMITHQRGVPCSETECPDCGVKMKRQR